MVLKTHRKISGILLMCIEKEVRVPDSINRKEKPEPFGHSGSFNMAISVPVPKDLSGIKTKVALNLTRRQIICFGMAAAAGIPLYFLTRGAVGTQTAMLLMVGVMLPFFFLAMYTRDGFPAEKILYFIIRQKFLVPGIRPYKSENLYRKLEEREKILKEVERLEKKAGRG